MAWFVVSLTLPVLAAYTLVAACDRGRGNDPATLALRLGLAVGIGLGLCSCGYFLWLFFVGPPAEVYHCCELAVFAAAAVVGLAAMRRRARLESSCETAIEPTAATPWRRLLCIAFCGAAVFAMLGAIGDYWREPLGGCDAWLIWNQRARGIFLGGEHWRQAFGAAYLHTDYPLLMPSGNARLWSYLGNASGWVPWLFGLLFTSATIAILAAGTARLRSRSQGLLAGLALLSMVAFVQRGVSQYADVPLAFFLLAAVLSIVWHDAEEHSRGGLLIISGLMAGLAAWTKNEGLLLLLVLPAARAVAVWRPGRTRNLARELAFWGAGALPILAIIAIQKGFLAGNNDLVSGQGWHATLGRVLDPWRYWQTAQGMLASALRTARPLAIVLPLCVILMGPARNRMRAAAGLRTAGFVMLFMLAGYFMVYITTPADLDWHLATSAERLLIHVWPLCLLLLFTHLATPEELVAMESKTNGQPAEKGLHLSCNSFTFEPELTCRLAQCRARIYEVPISCRART
jgi:hypothetical protein